MKTPVCDFVNKYVSEQKIRLHMPGHKGKKHLGCEDFDITEINGADVLYSGNGIIKESEENASLLFGTQKTLYSTEGSSLSIRAMLWLVKLYAAQNGKSFKIAAARNAHKTFVMASALLDCEVDWIYDENGGIVKCEVTEDTLLKYLDETTELPVAVYVTSPDYIGNTVDIRKLSELCHQKNILLLVDNAHGAYLRFLPDSLHPADLGADMCCDSAHKTLPVLTGGAYLHICKHAPAILSDMAENAMSVFASTSPSYLILQSLDMANLYISDGYTQKLSNLTNILNCLKTELAQSGYNLAGNEPLKLTLETKSRGYTGDEISDLLEKEGIVCEFSDPDYIVFMFTPETDAEHINQLKNCLLNLPQKERIWSKPPKANPPKAVLSLKEAMFSVSETVKCDDATGRILSVPNVSCPPAVPIAVSGELIDKKIAECMKYYGIEYCRVVL